MKALSRYSVIAIAALSFTALTAPSQSEEVPTAITVEPAQAIEIAPAEVDQTSDTKQKPALEANEPAPHTSILRVNVSHQPYNHRLPWQKGRAGSRRALGALLQDHLVLVTAELLSDASYIEFERGDSGRKLTARLVTIDYEANLALLRPEVDDASFFKGMIPLEVADQIVAGDQLQVWQFENNGSSNTTPTTVTKVEVGRVFLPGQNYLVYQTRGNVEYLSGSFTLPVAKDGKLAGLLLRYSSKTQISTVLSAPIIKHFLDDASDGNYEGFPSLGVEFTQTLDQQFRDYLGLTDEDGGAYISRVSAGGSAQSGGLKAGDIILEINGHKIDSRGNYLDPDYGLLSMGHLLKGNTQVGDTVALTILRDAKRQNLTITLKRRTLDNYLVDPYMFDRGPKYFVMGGLVFSELTLPYLQSFGDKWQTRAPFKLIYAMQHPKKYEEEGRRKLVFLSGVIPTKSTQGYDQLGGVIVGQVNGQQINQIADLATAFDNPSEDGLHEIELQGYPTKIWLDHDTAKKDNLITLPQRYRIQELQRLD